MSDLSADLAAVTDDLPALPEPEAPKVVQLHPDEVQDNLRKLVAMTTLPPGIAEPWERFKAELLASPEAAYFDADALFLGLATGSYHLWPGKQSGFLTTLFTFPTGDRAIKVVWGYGELGEMLDIEAGVIAWARMQGCKHALVEGRAGWSKALKAKGYEPWSTTVHKVL